MFNLEILKDSNIYVPSKRKVLKTLLFLQRDSAPMCMINVSPPISDFFQPQAWVMMYELYERMRGSFVPFNNNWQDQDN